MILNTGYPDIVISIGSKQHAFVKELKQRLNYHGYGPLNESNLLFGEQTRAAVIAFQIDKLLNPDGIVGPLTWHRLYTNRRPVLSIATDIAGVALEYALSQLYVREMTGKNDGEEVEAYLRSVGLGRGYAWCMAFIYWCYEQAAAQLSIGNPLYKTAGVLSFFNNMSKYRVSQPQKGDLGIMDFGGGKGHIFKVKKVIGNKVDTVEGNTSADPTNMSEDRDGQGVWERLRPISAANKGYIRISSS